MTSPDIRVLLVEDDLRLAALTRTYLESRGLEVIHTPDGSSALDLLRGNDVTAVVLDLMLPGIDGYEVCRRLRAFSDVPVLMVTALDAEGDRVLGLEVGADDYICKPFSSPELLARIRACARRYLGLLAPQQPALEVRHTPPRPAPLLGHTGGPLHSSNRAGVPAPLCVRGQTKRRALTRAPARADTRRPR